MIKANAYSHTITHCLFNFNGVRECFAFAKSHQPTSKPKLGGSVCLSNRTTKTTDKQADEKEHRSDNTGFAKWRVQCFYDSLVQGSSSVFQMKFVLKIPTFRKAAKR